MEEAKLLRLFLRGKLGTGGWELRVGGLEFGVWGLGFGVWGQDELSL